MTPMIVKSTIYLKLLDYCLLPVVERIRETIKDPLFMHDNAPIHTAGIVKDWFDENNVDVMDWPPYSPDLNPIEHVWKVMKAKL